MCDFLISIIVPVYNQENTISIALDSIINQSYKNFEIIVVDNASTDNTLNICREYQKKYANIKVIANKINGGVSKSRNIGIKNATGEYIGFVDSDDFIEPNMYERLLTLACNNHADIVQCAYFDSRFNNENNDNVSLSQLKSREDILISLFNNNRVLTFEVWNKLYSKNVLKNVCFDEKTKCGEDLLFNIDAFLNANNVCITGEKLYHYIVNENGLSKKDNFEDIYKVILKLESITEKINYGREILKNFYLLEINIIAYGLNMTIENGILSSENFDQKKKFLNLIITILKRTKSDDDFFRYVLDVVYKYVEKNKSISIDDKKCLDFYDAYVNKLNKLEV